MTESSTSLATLKKLTQRQRDILLFIIDHTRERGYQPSIREIGARFKIASPNGVACHLRAIQQKGWIGKCHGARALDISQHL